MREPKSKSVDTELDKVQEQFDKFDGEIKSMTHDRMRAAPKEETEQQTKMSTREAQNAKDIYLKPDRSIAPGGDPKTGFREKFNENFRADYEFNKERVKFIAENKEIGGEAIELWTKPYAGIPAEFWKVPVNKPVWGPRYLAEQIKRKYYNRLIMQNTVTNADGQGQYYGQLAVDTQVQRLDAHPVSEKKTMFMSGSF